jgi:acetyltransferase-like isoleucine patch superfamily enzyme
MPIDVSEGGSMGRFEPDIRGKIVCDDVSIGCGVVVEEGVEIHADRLVLGDFCFIGRESRIIVPEFRLGDYTKLHAFAFAHGKKPMHIGRNCWLGGNVVLDSNGGLVIDDGVGIGAHSQIWTHIQFGDIVEGCRDKWHGDKPMHIGKDAWLVGHCIVSPVSVGARSMAMAGSVVTKDMEPNHVFAGSPAKDLTDEVGPQFEERTIDEKAERLQKFIDEFETDNPEHKGCLKISKRPGDVEDEADVSIFNVYDRTYTKKYNEAEVAFLQKTVPLVKFAPAGEGEFVDVGVLDR